MSEYSQYWSNTFHTVQSRQANNAIFVVVIVDIVVVVVVVVVFVVVVVVVIVVSHYVFDVLRIWGVRDFLSKTCRF